MKLKLALIVALLGILFSYTNCSKSNVDACKNDTAYYPIKAEERAVLYGNGRDALHFVNTTTLDSFTFVGQGFSSFKNFWYTGPNDEMPCRNNFILDVYECEYFDTIHGEKLVLGINYSPFDDYPSTKDFRVEFQKKAYLSYLDFVVSPRLVDTVTYQGKIINAMSLTTNFHSNYPSSGLRAWYTAQLGLFKLELSNHQYLERVD